MNALPADIPSLRDRATELTEDLIEALEFGTADSAALESARTLGDALRQLLDMLDLMQDSPPGAGAANDLNTLGEYGLHLLDDLNRLSAQAALPEISTAFEQLCLPLGLWLARNGVEIQYLAPIVNAIASYTNSYRKPDPMIHLFAACTEVLDAVSPGIEDSASDDPHHPWRLLILNRAVIATRSHNPDLIRHAFDHVIESLPGEAQRFLSEAMEQVAVTDYPERVRDMVRQYFLQHSVSGQLH